MNYKGASISTPRRRWPISTLVTVCLAVLLSTGCAGNDHHVNSSAEPPAYEKGAERCLDPSVMDGPEICAQWASVRAARDAVHVSWVAIGWNIAGFGAIALTLFATAWAATAARRAAVAAEKAVGVSEDTAKRQLRAYVSLEKFQLDYRRDEQKKPIEGHFEGHWTNAGQTPAIAYRHYINWRSFDGPIPPDFEFPAEPVPSRQTGNLILGPGARIESVGEKFLITELKSAISEGRRFYVWSSADYEDIFGSLRRTEAAAEVMFRLLPTGEREPSFVALDVHTGMDEGCKYPPGTVKP